MIGGLLTCLVLYFAISDALYYENKFGEEYGTEWVLMADPNGDVHYVNLSSFSPIDSTRYFFGDVYFKLFTSRNKDKPEELYDEDGKLFNSEYFDPKDDVKVVTHGWLSSGDTDWIIRIKDAYLNTGERNVITVDWHEISQNIIYPWAALSTWHIGRRVAKTLDDLADKYKLSGDQIHLIGHSLGGQVMGYAGYFSSMNVSRITGLDPARPMFEVPYFGSMFALDESDATFVDIIHSCGGVLGYEWAWGNVDFFPNDGKARQPGCDGAQPMLEACSHGRSHEYFAESIESDVGFVAYPCDSWKKFDSGECKTDSVLMGEFVNRSASGKYYLKTNAESRYAMGP